MMIPISDLKNNDIDYKEDVISLSEEAANYLNSHKWCKKIINGWLCDTWGYMVCVFYFEIEPTEGCGADNFVWIIVGDIPPAYIDIESAKNVYEALMGYLELMEDWVEHVQQELSIEECYPIAVEPTKENAEMLASRIKIIKEDYITSLE